jgi:hypothetical protein
MARPTLLTHRKFQRLSAAVGSRALALGILELIWLACYEAGDDRVGTAEDVERLVGWTGEPGQLVRWLVECGAPEGKGFLERATRRGNGAIVYRVHDLWHHAPEYVRKRRARELQRRQRVAPRRVSAKRRRTAPNGGQCPPSLDSQSRDGRTPAPTPSTLDLGTVMSTSSTLSSDLAITAARASSAPINGTEVESLLPSEPAITLFPVDPAAPPRSTLAQRFARFWAAYPRKVAKQAAWRVWQRLKPDDALTERMCAALEAQRRSRQWTEQGGRFIPYPEAWLNQGRWEDELDTGPPLLGVSAKTATNVAALEAFVRANSGAKSGGSS